MSPSGLPSAGRTPPTAALPAEAEVVGAEQVAQRASPWLVSAVIHLLVLILLGLIVIARQSEFPVQLEASLTDAVGEQLLEEDLALALEPNSTEEQVITLYQPELAEDPFAAPPELQFSDEGEQATPPLKAPQIGLALRGRDEGMKQRLLAAYGGNGESEQAVENALRWLVKQQRDDGSWRLNGPYKDGAGFDNPAAATAMALLALQGAGHTHQLGKYRQHVSDGVAFLKKLQDDDGNFFQAGGHHDWFYTQGQCTIAVCELFGMTGDLDLKELAERAIWYCCRQQDEAGGWRYGPGSGSDLSVTGWVLMGLQSGRMAGLEVPYETLNRISEYLDRVALEGGSRYCYQPKMAPKLSMTAEGLLSRQYLGWGQGDPRLLRGAEFLVLDENLPSYRQRDVYYWYYATQMLHHLEGPHWEKWNSSMRDLLVKHQERSGPERGSWDPIRPTPDAWGHQGGRLYVTCLSVYVLEVYYRHLPLYTGVAAAQ